MSTEITIRSFMPQSMQEAKDFCSILSKSNFIPKEYQGHPENVFVALQWGAELGIQPLQCLQSIAVINGKPSIYGDLALAIVKNHPEFEWVKEVQNEAGATCTIKRKGSPEHISTFTVDDAKRANLWGKQGPWTQYPKRMLQMRARGFALRDVFPDALRGLITREEALDYPKERNITPETDNIVEKTVEVVEKLYEKVKEPEPLIVKEEPAEEETHEEPKKHKTVNQIITEEPEPPAPVPQKPQKEVVQPINLNNSTPEQVVNEIKRLIKTLPKDRQVNTELLIDDYKANFKKRGSTDQLHGLYRSVLRQVNTVEPPEGKPEIY